MDISKLILMAVLLSPSTTAFAQGDARDCPIRIEVPLAERAIDLKLAESRIACLMAGGSVEILDQSDGKPIVRIDRGGLPASIVALSRDGDWIAMGGPREMVPSSFAFVKATEGLPPAAGFGGGSGVLGVSGRPFEALERDLFYDGPRPNPSMKGPPRVPCGAVLTVRRVLDDGSARTRSDFPGDICALAVDESSVTAVTDGLKFFRMDRNMNISCYQSNELSLRCESMPSEGIVFSQDHRKMAYVYKGNKWDLGVAYYDANLAHAHSPLVLPPGSPAPWAIAISPDETKLAACGNRNGLVVWDLGHEPSGRLIPDGHTPPSRSHFVAFAGSSDRVLTLDDGGAGRIFDLATGRVVVAFRGPKRDVRAASCRDGLLTLVSGAYRYRDDGKVDPLVIQRIRIGR